MKTYAHTKSCMQMFIATLFVIVKNETNQIMNGFLKRWYIPVMQYYRKGMKF